MAVKSPSLGAYNTTEADIDASKVMIPMHFRFSQIFVSILFAIDWGDDHEIEGIFLRGITPLLTTISAVVLAFGLPRPVY